MKGNPWTNRGGAKGGGNRQANVLQAVGGSGCTTGRSQSDAPQGGGGGENQVQPSTSTSSTGGSESGTGSGTSRLPMGNVWANRLASKVAAATPKPESSSAGVTSSQGQQDILKVGGGDGPPRVVWNIQKNLEALSVKSEEQPKKDPGHGATAVVSHPAKSKEDLVIVQAINPKLGLLGEAQIEEKRKRPHRPKVDPPSKLPLIPVRANHFPVKFLENFPKTVYHYDVVITPKELKEKGEQPEDPLVESTVPDRLLYKIWHKFEEKFHKQLGARMPFDGKKNCYSAKQLKFDQGEVWNHEITMTDPDDDDKQRTYRIQLKLANVVDTSLMFTYLKTCTTWEYCELPQEVIQALDVALRYNPALRYTPCNRGFFSEKNPHPLSDSLELWFGHNQSLLLGRDEKATLNVDMANKAFMKRLPVEKFLLSELKLGQDNPLVSKNMPDSFFRKANDLMKGKLVLYGTGKRGKNGVYEKNHKFAVVGLVPGKNATNYQFTMNGKSMNIQEYFRDEKGIVLKHPEKPVIHVGNKHMTNYVPLELCSIVPQAYKGKLEAADTSEMIKGAAKPPKDRFDRIQNSRNGSGFENCPILKDFKMVVEPKMIEIPNAKKLPKPQMHYRNAAGNEVLVEPPQADGKFRVDKFYKGAELPKIGVLNVSGRLGSGYEQKVKQEFLPILGQQAKSMGMGNAENFTTAPIVSVKSKLIRGGNSSDTNFVLEVHAKLLDFKKAGCGLVVVIIGNDGFEYPTVKCEAEVQAGVLTQCIKDNTVRKVQNKGPSTAQVVINILLKINAKLGGLNFKLGQSVWERCGFKFKTDTVKGIKMQEPVLILGADVTHPAPNSKSPSVAALTASYDLSGICFQMHIQVQAATEEVINGLTDLVEQMLRNFKRQTGQEPTRIIMFRDGVSEGQFPAIKNDEYGGIKEACRKLNPGYNPKISFLVVKKRHHTRFLPVRQSDAVAPKWNIPPGTCVDNVITHPTEMEFFLNSHVGIQGTSKPTRYHVIHDDSKFTMEQLEILTYSLCYTFVRCSQPVSYPAPTYYAHLAAFRARALIEKEGELNVDLKVLQEKMTIHPDLRKKYPMFYV